MPKTELRASARLGASNELCGQRRAALRALERDLPREENLTFCFESVDLAAAPLPPMNAVERMQADYRMRRLTTGPHPMRLIRDQSAEIWKADEIAHAIHGEVITIGVVVICRQRLGTVKGFVFISLGRRVRCGERGRATGPLRAGALDRDAGKVPADHRRRADPPEPAAGARHPDRAACLSAHHGNFLQ